MLRRVGVALCLLLVVAAVVVPARAGWFDSAWDEARDKATACFNALDGDPAFQPIRTKSARTNPTLAQLGEDTYPSDADVEQLKLRDQAYRNCREPYLAAMRKEYPSLASALSLRYYQSDLVLLQLLDKRITFANANRLLQESYLQYRLHWDMFFELQSDRQRRAMADSLDDMQKRLQTGPQPAGPRSVRCNWIGPTLHCSEI